MIGKKYLKIGLIASVLVFPLFTRLPQDLKAKEVATTEGEMEIGAAAYFLFVFEGDLDDVQKIRATSWMKDYPDSHVFCSIFIGWLYPPIWTFSSGYDSPEMIDDGMGDKIESVLPHLKPIVVDCGNPYHFGVDKPAPRKVEDASKDKKVGKVFKSMVDIRYAFFKGGFGGDGGGMCFAPDTLVLMKNGELKKIVDIVKGDFVVGYDFELGKSVSIEVLKATGTPHENIYLLNSSIEATGEHPFYPKENDPVKLKNFSDDVKALLGDTDGDTNTLEEVDVRSIEKVEPKELYYDLKFESVHTYFVSDSAGNLYLVRECENE